MSAHAINEIHVLTLLTILYLYATHADTLFVSLYSYYPFLLLADMFPQLIPQSSLHDFVLLHNF